MSYRFRAQLAHVGMSEEVRLRLEKAQLQSRLIVAKSRIIHEADRLGLTYAEAIRLAKEVA